MNLKAKTYYNIVCHKDAGIYNVELTTIKLNFSCLVKLYFSLIPANALIALTVLVKVKNGNVSKIRKCEQRKKMSTVWQLLNKA